MTVVGGPVVQYVWPGQSGIGMSFPDPSGWATARSSSSASDPGCSTYGVSIDTMGIGNLNRDGTPRVPPDSPTSIHVDTTNTPPHADNNTNSDLLYAQPTFHYSPRTCLSPHSGL